MAADPDEDASAVDGSEESDEEWEYAVSDFDEEGAEEAGADDEDDGSVDAGVAGRLEVDEQLDPGEIDRENALFVLFGVVLALVVLAGFLNLWP